jgi:hypothetical protein
LVWVSPSPWRRARADPASPPTVKCRSRSLPEMIPDMTRHTVRIDWVVDVNDETALREAAFHASLDSLQGHSLAGAAAEAIAHDVTSALVHLATAQLLRQDLPGIVPVQVTIAP